MSLDRAWPEPELEAGEVLAWRERANLTLHGISRGGALSLTDRRLIFQPNSLERLFGQRQRSWSLGDVRSVGVAPRGPGPFSGAWRKRLRIGLDEGRTALFVVDSVENMVERIEAAL